MIRLEHSEVLQRIIRRDDVSDLAIPTLTLVRQAILEGRASEAIEFLEYASGETLMYINSRTGTIDEAIIRLARVDEAEVEKFWRDKFYQRVVDSLAIMADVEQSLQIVAEMYRGLFSDFTIVEEADKYVVGVNSCTGLRLRRSGPVATTKEPHPWSWGRSGVCLYCTHCCIRWEIMPIELRGYPVKTALYNENVNEPCIQLFYKKPESIPEEYFRSMMMPVYGGR